MEWETWSNNYCSQYLLLPIHIAPNTYCSQYILLPIRIAHQYLLLTKTYCLVARGIAIPIAIRIHKIEGGEDTHFTIGIAILIAISIAIGIRISIGAIPIAPNIYCSPIPIAWRSFLQI